MSVVQTEYVVRDFTGALKMRVDISFTSKTEGRLLGISVQVGVRNVRATYFSQEMLAHTHALVRRSPPTYVEKHRTKWRNREEKILRCLIRKMNINKYMYRHAFLFFHVFMLSVLFVYLVSSFQFIPLYLELFVYYCISARISNHFDS